MNTSTAVTLLMALIGLCKHRDPMQSGRSYPGGFCNDPRSEFSEFPGPDECRFHRDCVELDRCFHILGRHTVEAQLARREARPVPAGSMQAAIGNLVRIIELSDRLGTFEYRRDWYVEAIAAMRREVRRRGQVPV